MQHEEINKLFAIHTRVDRSIAWCHGIWPQGDKHQSHACGGICVQQWQGSTRHARWEKCKALTTLPVVRLLVSRKAILRTGEVHAIGKVPCPTHRIGVWDARAVIVRIRGVFLWVRREKVRREQQKLSIKVELGTHQAPQRPRWPLQSPAAPQGTPTRALLLPR